MDLPRAQKVKGSRVDGCIYVLGNDGAEPRSANLYVRIAPPAYPRNLCTNILAFSITVRPYHEHLGTSSFVAEILSNSVRIGLDFTFYGSIEQCKWIARGPFGIHGVEVVIHYVASYGCNSKGSIHLRIVEIIILDVLVGTVTLLHNQHASTACLEGYPLF